MNNFVKAQRLLCVSISGTIKLTILAAFSLTYAPLQPYFTHFLICGILFGVTLISNIIVQAKLKKACNFLGLKYTAVGGAIIPLTLFVIGLLLR